MRTIIAGSRGFTDIEYLYKVMASLPWKPTVVLSGTARGVDQLGEQWAEEYDIPIERYPADWNRFGKSAGYRRNELMARNAEALVVLWDGRSKGTKHMIDLAETHKLTVLVDRRYEKEEN